MVEVYLRQGSVTIRDDDNNTSAVSVDRNVSTGTPYITDFNPNDLFTIEALRVMQGILELMAGETGSCYLSLLDRNTKQELATVYIEELMP